MSEEAREPKTFEDLWLMLETSREWFDGLLRCENMCREADPKVGMIDSVSWHVVPSSDRVMIIKKTHVISEVRQGWRSFSCLIESETVAEYRSMEDFRASEWWGLTMEKLDGGDADASWLRTVDLDGEEVDTDLIWIGYGPSTCLDMKVGRQYRDWLGNTRQDNGHDTLSIRAKRMSGELWLRCGGHEVEGTVEEIEAAMKLADRLKSIGVEVGDESITVPLRKGDDGR